jgi:toluene monooxygenase system ferredoxin subunit
VARKRLCSASEIAENTLKKVELGGVSIIVARVDGAVVAFPPLCPHMAEPLEISGVCDGGTLTCTKHLWQWELPSGNETGMAEKPLLLYPIAVEGDEVWIEFEGELVYDYDE